MRKLSAFLVNRYYLDSKLVSSLLAFLTRLYLQDVSTMPNPHYQDRVYLLAVPLPQFSLSMPSRVLARLTSLTSPLVLFIRVPVADVVGRSPKEVALL